jgi:hypothetical protein
MTEETKAGLKLLAEYMYGQHEFKILDQNKMYNTSWDALVPVYAKVYKQNVNKYVSKLHIAAIDAYMVANTNNNPQAAFEAVVELVKLINKENAAAH